MIRKCLDVRLMVLFCSDFVMQTLGCQRPISHWIKIKLSIYLTKHKCLYAVNMFKLCQWFCCGKTPFKVNSVALVLFFDCTTSETIMYLSSCDTALCKKIDMWQKKKMCGSIHTSNKKGHKNWGLLLKSLDYIIEWNAPAPVYGLQASWWLFPGSIARVMRLHNTTAGRVLWQLCARLAPPFKWISWNAQYYSHTIIETK